MGVRVTITFDGLEKALDRLSTIEEKAPQNLQKQTKALASGTQEAWKSATHVRSGKLQGGEHVDVEGLSFTLKNNVRYYDWVNDGHMTPRGWRTKRGYRIAKRRSHVEGQEMTQKAVEFVEQNAEQYLSKFLDDL